MQTIQQSLVASLVPAASFSNKLVQLTLASDKLNLTEFKNFASNSMPLLSVANG